MKGDAMADRWRTRVQEGARGIASPRTDETRRFDFSLGGVKSPRRRTAFGAFIAAVASLFVLPAVADYTTITDEEALELGGASGGDIIRKIDNGNNTCDLVHIFTNTSASATLQLPNAGRVINNTLRLLVVGGGGGGGGNCSAGGGAGGLIYKEGLSLAAGDFSVTVGGGGAGGRQLGEQGTNTVVNLGSVTYTALGGGVGGNYGSANGTAGGSGGGASCAAGAAKGTVGAANQPDSESGGYGNDGGAGGTNGAWTNTGGGGGGAGGPGGAASQDSGGAGGAGMIVSITGEDQVYAAGGGGGGCNSAGGGAGGGVGSVIVGGVGGGATAGTAGLDGTGSGGGGSPGGQAGGAGTAGGKGGDGIVVIRYTVKVTRFAIDYNGETVIVDGASTNWVDGELILKYTDISRTGSLVLPKSMQAWVLAVGGGGAGANAGAASQSQGGAGGGGAGGYYEQTNSLAGGTYAITVGGGGASPTAQGNGGNGTNSVIRLAGVDLITAYGGGGGGIKSVGLSGGSGGGGSRAVGGAAEYTGSPANNVGNAGGEGTHNRSGAGGGGAGGEGGGTVSTSEGGSGGAGKYSSITGSEVMYAAGGGGGSRTGTGGTGGKDSTETPIGGNGGGSAGGATNGRANTGSGGGGGCYDAQQGGNGGSGIVIIRIVRIMPEKPVAPGDITFDGLEHVIAPTNDPAFTVTGTSIATAKGDYSFTATLNAGYTWSDGTADTVSINWKILPAQLFVKEFSLVGWQIGEAANKPKLVVLGGEGGTEVELTDAQKAFKYSSSRGGPWFDDVPTTVGTWYVKAIIEGTDDFSPPAEEPVAEFEIWNPEDGVLDGLGYHALISVTNYTGTATLTNFPMLVRIREGFPGGFSYSQTAAGGKDLRFTDLEGNIIPHEIDEWNEGGTSIVWVKVPEYKRGDVAYMYWGIIDGATIPAAHDPKEVWSDYIGVWHFNEDSGTAHDATGHGLDGTPSYGAAGSDATVAEMVATDGIVGNARVNATTDSYQGNYMSVPDYSSVTNPGGVLTVSGWFKTTSVQQWPLLIAHKTHQNDNGWELLVESATMLAMRGNGTTRMSVPVSDITTDWVFVTAAYSNTWGRLSFYNNATPDGLPSEQTVLPGTSTVVGRGIGFGNWANGASTSFCGSYDEIHIRAGVTDPDWILAEWQQIHEGVISFGHVNISTNSVFANRWIEEPTISPLSWFQGSTPAIAKGKAAYGVSYYTVTSADGTVYTNEMPTAAGAYTFNGVVDAGMAEGGNWGWSGLKTDSVIVTILSASPRTDLSGTAGSSTLSGRVLLANDDVNTKAPVTGQTIDLTTGDAYWVHANAITNSTDINAFPNLTPETTHEFISAEPIEELCGATSIWRLENVRIGNTYPGVINLDAFKNFLPYSSTMRGLSTSTRAQQKDSKHLVMRNMVDASITSPCYTNGIGTIYFDAVNAWNKSYGAIASEVNGEFHQIAVEICTGVTADASDCTWTPVNAIVLVRDGGDDFVYNGTTANIPLHVQNGGTMDNFYRIIVPFNGSVNEECRGPVRFRIRRVTDSSLVAVDRSAFILIDNIVVSYPAMRADIEPLGLFDREKGGKAALGTEAAWSVPFPSVGDAGVTPRAKAWFSTNPGDTNANVSAFITAATMHYRWRYLDQCFGDWKKVTLDPSALSEANPYLGSFDSIDITNSVGDIEYWYEIALDAPYYNFVDYSGSELGVKYWANSDETEYMEVIPFVTNACNSASYLESHGTNWFVRLREGKSNWERFEIQYYTTRKADDENAYNEAMTNGNYKTVPLEIIKDHVWRGNLQTLDPTNLHFRIVGRNRQVDGAKEFVTNVTYFALPESTTNDWPISTIYYTGDSNSWHHIWADAATGYLMFQLDDGDATKSITIVHSDYQNVNAWNDANRGEELFLGSSTEDPARVGASPRARTFEENFSGWIDMPVTYPHWNETFDTGSASIGKDAYTTFASHKTPQRWIAGQGMYVYERYRDLDDSDKRYAFQMEGCGRGYIDFVDAANSPRGIGTISFSARLAQSIAFDDFAYYMGDGSSSQSNYAFTAWTAFDLNKNEKFRGNASLSLVAYYRPGAGCYEYRIEPFRSKKQNDVPADGWDTKTTVHSLHRWRYVGGKMQDTLLGKRIENTEVSWPGILASAKDNSDKRGYVPMFISVSNDVQSSSTWIMAGFAKSAVPYSELTANNKTYWCMAFRDTDAKLRLTKGSYGVLSANCEGVFQRPQKWNAPITLDQLGDAPAAGQARVYTPKDSLNFGTSPYDTSGDINEDPYEGDWYVNPGRMRPFKGSLGGSDNDSYLYGFTYTNEVQTISIYTAPKGTSDWTPLVSNIPVKGFGSASGQTKFTFTPYSTADCSVRIAVDGDVSDTQRDVVIDDISLTQWRGTDYDDSSEFTRSKIPNWSTSASSILSNFVFTSAWITNSALRLSARRTATNGLSSIRSPWMDGNNGRGLGLGMLSFNYRNAQTNTVLLLQICTNSEYNASTMGGSLYAGDWVTIETNDFVNATPQELLSGTRSYYLGLHGVAGAFRLIVDRELTRSVGVNNVTDASAFGDIDITRIVVRDEPNLDESAWWGWNIRTIGADADNRDAEGRMYLYDLTSAAEGLPGLSVGLNNSVTENCDTTDEATYKVNYPFVQTPTFGTNIVGEVQFRARLYKPADTDRGIVALFGTKNPLDETAWKHLNDFEITGSTYESFSFKTSQNDDYKAFRLAILGVEGVTGHDMHGDSDVEYAPAQRILLDELLVSEAVRARVGFRKVGAFRSLIGETTIVPNVPSKEEQPLCNEDFGIQCEIYKAQLPDEIDFSVTPRVKLYWIQGVYPWGFDVWKTNKNCKTAYLTLASDSTESNLVYRSSLRTSQDSVISIPSTPGTVIQYALEVQYLMTNATAFATNYLDSTWTKPEWYRGIDYNSLFGNERHFSAYTILDTVAPGWAWINEMNIFGKLNGDNADRDCQYIEIAVPQEADITGWYVNILAAHTSTDEVVTNRVATFGDGGLKGKKKEIQGAVVSNMVFRVIANQATSNSGKLDWNTGEIDGIWRIETPTVELGVSGELGYDYPLGVQLVRPSGIIEHEIVAEGTNRWTNPDLPASYRLSHDPTNAVNFLNNHMPGSAFFLAGEDNGDITKSLGVFASRGESSEHWNNTMTKTPGRINADQTIIRPESTMAKGSNVMIFFNLDSSVGHIYQQIGDGPVTNVSQIIYMPKGSSHGTNVTYRVDSWYELATVTTNGTPITLTTPPGTKRTYVANNVGANVSNAVTVLASAQIQPNILSGVEDRRYLPAVMDWLEKGKTLKGDFAGDEFQPAEYISHWSHSKIADLSLLEMYWLDMDPTVGNLALEAGFVSSARPVRNDPYWGFTNTQMTIFMMITNRTEDTESDWYGKAWTPYTIRGLDPGSNSRDDYPGATLGWTSVTFKVTGIIANGLTGMDNKDNWIPLRWFVFDDNSFAPLDGSADAGTAKIEVDDPHTSRSPAYDDGFKDWPDCDVFYRWAIDTRLKPFTVEILNSNSLLNVTGP